MRISNYPTETLDGTEMILATNVDATTQKYTTVNFSTDALKTFVLGGEGEAGNQVVFEGTQPDQWETVLTTLNPTTDNTINLPNVSGTIGVFANNSYTLGTELITSTPAELNILDGITSTTAELNILDGVTSTTAELNILDGVTSTAAEINLLDGSVAETAVNSKGVIYGAAGKIAANGIDITGKISQIDSEVAHGMTALGTTSTYFSTEINHATFGGVMIRGMSDSADGLGIRLYGTIGHENPTDTIAAVEIRGSKRGSVSSTHAALADTETVFKLGNLDTDLITVLGSGDTTIANNLTVTGVTVADNLTVNGHIDLADSKRLRLGGGQDMLIEHDGTDAYVINQTGNLILKVEDDNKDIVFTSDDGSGGVATYFHTSSANSSGGNLYTTFPDNSRLVFGNSFDLKIYHDTTNSYITNAVGALKIATETSGIAVTIGHTTSEVTIADNLTVTGGGTFAGDVTLSAATPKFIIKMPEVDHGMTALGTTDTLFSIERKHGTQGGALIRAMSDDAAGIPLQIYGTIGHHDPTDTVAAIELRGSRKNGSGLTSHAALADGETVLKIGNLGTDLITVKGNGDTTITGLITGNSLDIDDVLIDGTTIGHTDDTDLLTLADGVLTVAGHIDLADSKRLRLGSSQDMLIDHDGSNANIINQTGHINIKVEGDNQDIIFISDDGSGGVATYFQTSSGNSSSGNLYTNFPDNSRLTFGNSFDLQIYHKSSDSTSRVEGVDIIKGTSESIAGNGALAATSVAKMVTYYATSGGPATSTLATGEDGQQKMLAMTADGGNMVVTVTNPAWGGSGTITFDDVGEGCTLVYVSSKWCVVGNNNCAFA